LGVGLSFALVDPDDVDALVDPPSPFDTALVLPERVERIARTPGYDDSVTRSPGRSVAT
jgi:hypothetical protein